MPPPGIIGTSLLNTSTITVQMDSEAPEPSRTLKNLLSRARWTNQTLGKLSKWVRNFPDHNPPKPYSLSNAPKADIPPWPSNTSERPPRNLLPFKRLAEASDPIDNTRTRLKTSKCKQNLPIRPQHHSTPLEPSATSNTAQTGVAACRIPPCNFYGQTPAYRYCWWKQSFRINSIHSPRSIYQQTP